MTALLREWRRESTGRPFDAAAWNRLANVNNGRLAAFTTWVDEDGGPLVASDPAAKTATLAGAFAVGAGAAAMTGTLSVSGLFSAAAAATVGTTLGVTGAATFGSTVGVTGKLTAGSAEITGLFQAAAAATVGTTLTVGGHASAGTASVGAAALVGSEKLYVAGGVRIPQNSAIMSDQSGTAFNMLRMDNSGILRIGTPAVLRTFLYGADDLSILDSAGNVVFRSAGNQMTFFNGSSTAGRGAVGAAATDLPTVITLANNLRALVRSFNLSS